MLQALVKEPEKLVKNSIAQLIGIIGKHEFPDNTWPEVFQFIHTLCSSDVTLDKEVSIMLLQQLYTFSLIWSKLPAQEKEYC